MQSKSIRFEKRTQRVRNVINKQCIVPRKSDIHLARHRMTIIKSSRHLYVQIIDMNNNGHVVCAVSTLTYRNEEKKFNKSFCNKTYAAKLGADLVAKLIKLSEVKKLVVDRGGNKYIGNIKVLVDSARDAWISNNSGAEKAPF